MSIPASPSGPPLYESRTFEFNPDDERLGIITITLDVREVRDDMGAVRPWSLVGPAGGSLQLSPGTYTLRFTRNSPPQLASLKIDPDPGGGRVP